MNFYRWHAAFCIYIAVFCFAGTGAAQEIMPQWVYDAVNQLDEEGYIDLSGRSAETLTREELTKVVAQGLHEIDRVQQWTLADEHGRITSLAVRDEVHLKLYREQEKHMLKAYQQAQSDAVRAEELLARQSMRGENRLEVVQPLQERASAASKRLQFSARDYALAKTRRQTRELAYEKLLERQRRVFARLTSMDDGDLSGESMQAEPLVGASVINTAARLRSELLEELTDMGYTDVENAERQLYAVALLPEACTPRVKVDGEVRINASRASGIERGDSRSRARACSCLWGLQY